ncbi:MAG: hypothetical protein H6735_01455 [Alphaproteobacteria bacterium]|nr:hypothetical protein [Alphaproteobacteria bacterium]
MSDHAHDLLVQVRKATELRRKLAEEGKDTSEVDEALDGLYRDLGRAVAETDGSSLLVPDPPTVTKEAFTSEVPDEEDSGGWYTDERVASTSGPLFDPADLGEPLMTDVPVPDDLNLPPDPDDTDASDAQERGYAVETVHSMGSRASDPTTSLGIFRYGVATWKGQLDELLDLLRSPFDLDDPTELGVEASRVQWATTDLPHRLEPYPDEIKIALIGLLAARAQFLRTRLDVDVGARLSLDRLQRYRIERSLASVPGLLPTPLPELGSWLIDSEAWWAVFRPRSGTP